MENGYEYDVAEGFFLFYSATAEMKYGSVIYETEHNDRVYVTYVSRDFEGKNYNYDDKICLGKAVRYIGKGRKGNFFCDLI